MTRVACMVAAEDRRERLMAPLRADRRLEIVACARDAAAVLRIALEHRPDVLLLDAGDDCKGAIDATRLLMREHPLPIVALAPQEAEGAGGALQALREDGAALVLPVQGPGVLPDGPGDMLAQVLHAIAQVKVVRRRAARAPAPRDREQRFVLVGASTGGPAALRTVLAELGRDFPFPIVIVQHMATGLTGHFAHWLGAASGFPVALGHDGLRLRAGTGYIVPEGVQASVDRAGRLVLGRGAPEHGMAPSVSHLFRESAAGIGARAIAVLLSGMGADGAVELQELKNAGACTIVQDRASSAAFGMAGTAIRHGAAQHVLPPEAIGRLLAALGRGHGAHRLQEDRTMREKNA